MSGNGKSGRPPHQHHSKQDSPQPYDDQIGVWPREQLERMDRRFVDRVERAIAAGDENPAAAINGANAPRLR